jgi:hypothetical protein
LPSANPEPITTAHLLSHVLQVYNPKHIGFPRLGVSTMQVTVKPSAVTARFYVAAVPTSAEVGCRAHSLLRALVGSEFVICF